MNNNLMDILPHGGDVGPEAEQIKSELHQKQKEALIGSLEKTREILVSLSTTDRRSSQIVVLRNIRERIGEVAKVSRIKENRSMLVKMFNKFDSLIGGLESLDYASRDVKILRQNAISRLREVIELEAATKEIKISPIWRKHDPEKEDDEEEKKKDKSYYEKMDSEKQLERVLKDAPKLLQKYSKGEKGLNLLIAKKYNFAKVPIIPLTKPPLEVEELRKYGFPVQQIGMYPILEEQLVLGLNPTWLRTLREDKQMKGKKPEHIADHIRQQLNKQAAGKNYHILGPAQKHKTGLYYWLMPERSVNLLIKSISKKVAIKKLHVERWGFAFSHEWNT